MSLVETFNTSLRKCLDGIGRYKRNGGSNYDSLKLYLERDSRVLILSKSILLPTSRPDFFTNDAGSLAARPPGTGKASHKMIIMMFI